MSHRYDDLTDYVLEKIHAGECDIAFHELENNVSQGDADSLALLGGFYIYGIGVDTDIQQGINMLEKSVQMECGDACYELWKIYSGEDQIVRTDYDIDINYLRKGMELGNSKCYGDMGCCYLNGEYVVKNPKLGYDYSKIAAEDGVPCGIINCAICNDDGIGTVRNAYEASQWYRKYLEMEPDNDFAMVRLAICLADPYEMFGISISDDMLREALFYCEQAMLKDNPEAYLIYGWFYEMGKIVPQNYDEAYKYIKKSAELGNDFAKEHLKSYFKDIFGRYYVR